MEIIRTIQYSIEYLLLTGYVRSLDAHTMPNLFEVTDPRGRQVICTAETWKDHILENHPDIEGHEAEVRQAIERPSLGIYQDSHYENRHVYYSRYKRRPRYIKVVVAFDEEDGSVITAFFADSTKAGEKMIWPLSSI